MEKSHIHVQTGNFFFNSNHLIQYWYEMEAMAKQLFATHVNHAIEQLKVQISKESMTPYEIIREEEEEGYDLER